jgi:flagellar M-ring protein FliF
MNFIGQLISQLSSVFGSQTAARRVVVFAVIGISIAGLVYLMFQARVGSYKTLYTSLSQADAAEAAGKLQQANIPTRFGENGSILQVPSRKFDQALMILAQEGLPNSGTPGYDELMGKSNIGVSDFELKVRYHRSLEGELARTIMAIHGVERARVHLALPKPTLFVRETPKPTASVILKIRSGAKLTDKEVNGIVLLVAGAVEGLEPESVSIIDDGGNLLNINRDPKEGAAIGDRVAYKIEYENLLKDRVESMLERTVGKGKVVAHVSADFDFAQRTVTQETFDPDSQVVRRETTLDEGTGGPGVTPTNSGVTGSDANIPPEQKPGGGFATNANAAKKRSDRETMYEISRTNTQIVETVPLLQRLSVSVLVDGNYVERQNTEGDATREFVARDAREIATFEETVKNAIGFSDERPGGLSDQVTVKSVAFQLNDVGEFTEVAEPMMNPDLIRDIVQWALVAIIGFVLIFAVLRPAVKSVTIIPGAALTGLAAGGALPEGAVHRTLPGGATAGALPRGEERSKLSEEVAQVLQRANELSTQLGSATAQDVPRAAGVIRQWLEEKR